MRPMLDCLKDMDIGIEAILPEELTCPLTNVLFDTPVLTPGGNTYESNAILQHLKYQKFDPISKESLTEKQLFPNNAVLHAVEMYKKKCEWFTREYWWEN